MTCETLERGQRAFWKRELGYWFVGIWKSSPWKLMVWNILSTGANLANYSIEPIIVTNLTKNYYSLYRTYVTEQ
jgi:hypothetical protein